MSPFVPRSYVGVSRRPHPAATVGPTPGAPQLSLLQGERQDPAGWGRASTPMGPWAEGLGGTEFPSSGQGWKVGTQPPKDGLRGSSGVPRGPAQEYTLVTPEVESDFLIFFLRQGLGV